MDPHVAGAEPDSEAVSEQPDTAACLAAHVKAQALKKETRFKEAQEQLLICSTASCPGPVIEDCGEWIGELDRRTPSLAFSVTLDGVESQEARVTLNGDLITDREGITKVDPGRHVVRAELAPFPVREQVVFARDGGGTQVVDFEFETAKSAPGAPGMDSGPPEPASRPTPTIVYPLLGLSAAGFASFGVFALIGNQRKSELERECEPACSDEQLQPMKNSYLIGDISLAVGAASLLTATIVYLARPTDATPGQDVALQLHPVVGLEDRGSFGVVAVQAW
ncbi:MAG TPA: hypothetical protein VI197_20330 [Polyangiaceae bacterium]